jgi:hypothetical protein
MASATSNKYKELLHKKIINFASDTFKIMLMVAGFTYNKASHSVKADVLAFELPTAYGYTVGGYTLSGVAIATSTVVNASIVTWNNATWTASGGNIIASGAIIYDDTITTPDIDPIIGYIDFLGNMITYDGGTFVIAGIATGNR